MQNSKGFRVVIVDRELLLLDSLALAINADEALEVVAAQVDIDEGLNSALQTQPHVILVAVEFADTALFEQVCDFVRQNRRIRTILLSTTASSFMIERAIAAQVHGLILKEEPLPFLIESLKNVARGGTCFSESVQRFLEFDPEAQRHRVVSSSPNSTLSPRQIEVMRHLAHGESVREVARSMQLSEKSVESHKYRIMHKLGIHNRVRLARFAIREGLIRP